MRGAVVVASLLSQLSQQCGAALVRVRDKVSRSTPLSRVVARRAVLPSCAAQASAQECAGHNTRAHLCQTCGVETVVRAQTPGPSIEAPPRRRERNKYRS